MDGQRQLTKSITAVGSCGGSPRPLDRGKRDCRQYPANADHDEELSQREPTMLITVRNHTLNPSLLIAEPQEVRCRFSRLPLGIRDGASNTESVLEQLPSTSENAEGLYVVSDETRRVLHDEFTTRTRIKHQFGPFDGRDASLDSTARGHVAHDSFWPPAVVSGRKRHQDTLAKLPLAKVNFV
jgi:hypothetical protein